MCQNQFCRDELCSPLIDQYCFDTVSEEVQGDSTYCAADYHYNGSTWNLRWKQCLYLSNISCVNNSRCVLQQFSNLSHYTCCCKSDYCNSNNKIDFPFGHVTMVTPTPPMTFTITVESNQSTSLPVLVTFIITCIGIITMLNILTALWYWYIFKRCSTSLNIQHEKDEPRNALEEEEEEDDSPREDQMEILDMAHSPRQSRFIPIFEDKTSATTGSPDVIELAELSVREDSNEAVADSQHEASL